ncbi:hypothetical protein CsSME_00038361 [Camellia sinensis var. sinensis]
MGALFLLKGLVTVAYLLLLLLGKVLLKCWMNSLSIHICVVYFLFNIPGYNNFKVVCDGDAQNMLTLAKSFGIDHIDVLIQTQSDGLGVGCGLADSSNVSDCDNSKGLMYDIEDRGSAHEFQTVLCKYSVEYEYQFKYIKNDSVWITIVCKFATSTGCSWLVHTRVATSNGVRFKGNLLAATTKDGNQGNFRRFVPGPFAIVDSENASNWEWFLH